MSEIVVVITGATGPSGGGGGSTALDDLTDVVITAAASGDIIRHNGTNWVDAVGTTHFEAAGAAAAAQAASQPLDSDLTAIAALTTTAYGRAFLALADQAATMALLSASSTTASGIVELATSAETITGTDTVRAVTPAGGAAAYQPLDSDLTAIAALTSAADKMAYSTGAGTWALTDFTSTARSLLDDASVTAMRTTLAIPETLIIAVGDETTAITTGTAKVTFRMPFAMTVTAVRSSLTTASSSGLPTVDINEGGTTILSTKLTIDANELTSTTAATAAVISDSALADDASITIDIDTAGTGAAGLKVYITGTRT